MYDDEEVSDKIFNRKWESLSWGLEEIIWNSPLQAKLKKKKNRN